MSLWQRNGIPVDDDELQELGLVDQIAECECDGVRFMFRAETVERDARGYHAHSVVLTLRQLDRASEASAIDLVEIVEDGRLSCRVPERAMRHALAASFETSERLARRYATVQLFHTAKRLLAARAVA